MSVHDEIAIVGMAGRFPGADSVAELWRLLRAGREGIVRQTGSDGRHMAAGGPLAGIEDFDAEFFAISPGEAEITDPQHRLFLECSWEALEEAGVDPASDLAIGVFAGCSLSTYLIAHLLGRRPGAGSVDDLPALLANDKDYLATRVSYKLGLHGPSVGVQTACSTSLVAVHLACQSLIAGECDVALAGGATVRLPQVPEYRHQEGGYLAPDGHCRAFDARAAGTVFGNGVGVVTLKRRVDAEAEGDAIAAIIKGSAINNDGGAKVGFTAPSVEGQVEVIAEAVEIAGVAADTITYVETHGTGTPLGDPIEVSALGQVYGDRRQPCALGSVKTNLGHLESAAGVASLIKATLALQHRELPPSLHFESPNPDLDLRQGAFRIQDRLEPWEPDGVPRRAAVSSFGIGGTNAHLILEEAPLPEAAPMEDPAARLLILSARSSEALRARAQQFADWLLEAPGWSAVTASAALRRSQHEERLALPAHTADEARELLTGWLDGRQDELVASAAATSAAAASGERPRIAFVYSGQGAQWWAMGRELLETSPVFRQEIEALDGEIRSLVSWSLLEELTASESASRLDGDSITITQVSLFALQVALTGLWRSWGVEADAVLGHSMGEVAAAWASGALDRRAAVEVIVRRSRLLEGATGQGAMAAVELTLDEARRWAARDPEHLSVAASNGPRMSVLSGQRRALEGVLEELAAEQVWTRPLRTTGVAGHSPQVEGIRRQLESQLAGLVPRAAERSMISTVTGGEIAGSELDARYWGRNLRQTVRFAEAVAASGCDLFVEIGAHPVLTGAVREVLPQSRAWPSLVREEPERQRLLATFGHLWSVGAVADLQPIFPSPAAPCSLPPYPWQRQRHWIEPSSPAAPVPAGLLGERIPLAGRDSTHLWHRRGALPSWLDDHRVEANPLLPAAASIDAVRQALEAQGHQEVELIDGRFDRPLFLTPDTEPVFQVVHEAEEGRCAVLSREAEGPWREHFDATLGAPVALPSGARLAVLEAACPQRLDGDEHYRRMAAVGVQYGPAFRTVDELRLGEDQSLVRLREGGLAPAFAVLLDGALQALAALPAARGQAVVPESFAALRWRPGLPHWAHASLSADGQRGAVRWLAADGTLLGELVELQLRPLEATGDALQDVFWETSRCALAVPEIAPSRAVGEHWLAVSTSPSALEKFQTAVSASAVSPRLTVELLVGGEGAAGLAERWAQRAPQRLIFLSSGEAGGDSDQAEVALAFAQAVSRLDSPPACSWLTAGVQAGRDPAGAALWALARSLEVEGVGFPGKCIDVEEADHLIAEILDDGGESEVVLAAGGRRSALRLQPSPSLRRAVEKAPQGEDFALRPDRSYLITGGLGGLGLAVANRWATLGAGRIVLAAHRSAFAEEQAVIDDLVAAGGKVSVVSLDVRDGAAVERLVAAQNPPIGGIVHAAGRLADGTLETLDGAQLRQAWEPKALGAWNLHRATLDAELDFFVLFGSVATWVGSAGQSTHAAANGFLDGLALYRRRLGLPASSIGWGAWSEVGKAVGAERELASRGYRGLTTELGLAALTAIVASPGTALEPCLAVAPWSFDRWRTFYPEAAMAPRFAELATVPAASADLATRLAALAAGWPRQLLLEGALRQAAGEVLGLAGDDIDGTQPLRDLGLDSLRALELRNRLEGLLVVSLPATLLWRFPTVSALAEHLLEEVLELPSAKDEEAARSATPEAATSESAIPEPAMTESAAAPAAVPAADLGAVDDLSEAEVEALLAQTLDALDERGIG
ncbi:MAG: SDR family NAD(P)-dependent oxidoreductase [Acidobacteriota bacterium]